MIRAGVIGLGVGLRHAEVLESHPSVDLVAVCDFDNSVLEGLEGRFPSARRETEWRSVVHDPSIDLVSIASYDEFHHTQVVEALNANKHVFVEKPLCLDFDEFLEVVEVAQRLPNLSLSSNLVLRLEPRFVHLRDRIFSGELGDVYAIDGSYVYGRFEKITHGWRGRSPGYSVMHGGGIHLIDLMLWLKRSSVTEVYAVGTRIASVETQFQGLDTIYALLKFEDGSVGKVAANFPSVTPHHHLLSVYGTKGTFVQGYDEALSFHKREEGVVSEVDEFAYPVAPRGQVLRSFIGQVLGHGPAVVTREEVLSSMAVSLAVTKSIADGRPVQIYDFGDELRRA